MNGLEIDPREVKRSFSLPISLDYHGPAFVVDDNIILLTKIGGFTPIVQIFAPNSMHIVRQRVLELGGYKPPKNPGDPNRITALELKIGFNEGRSVIYIGSDKYKLTLEDVIENLSYFSMHSPQVIRTREVNRHQDLKRVLGQLIRQ